MHLTNIQLLGLMAAAILADDVVGIAKAIFSDKVKFSLQLLPKGFVVLLPLSGMAGDFLSNLQSSFSGGANVIATAGLTALCVTVILAMVNDIKNKITSWVQGTTNLSPSTTDAILGIVNVGAAKVEGELQTLETAQK